MRPDEDKMIDCEENADNTFEGNLHKVEEFIANSEERSKDSEEVGALENVSNVILKSKNKKTKKGKRSFIKHKIFSIIDPLISVCIIAPMCIGFWRGLWGLLDIYAENKLSLFFIMIFIILYIIFNNL
ncbi:uncharacterized protein LOC117178890 [Belonocnema kinseyi]|uniref:uncharacterized protein LOC117178890 n=1 Tax=Belonocnema kinseyi TaxID=2817044 RepID=UPI00143D1EEC|nr:uncharacterized protein LOC117178890 [Belonocnema kinseyi]